MNRSSGLMEKCGRDSARWVWVSVGGCVGGDGVNGSSGDSGRMEKCDCDTK